MKPLRAAAAAAAALLLWAQGLPASENPSDFFEERIRPLLAQNCFSCHTDSPQKGLRLDSRESILKGGQSGPAVVPGDPETSLLIQAVRRTHPRLKMPPQDPLDPDQVRDLETWVRTGAFWPEAQDHTAKAKTENGNPYRITPEQRSFWSFQPLSRPAPPATTNRRWPRSAIDRFILARLESQGMQPVQPAGRRVLIRRASFDLIGLPPTPEEVEAFLQDSSPLAFAKVVDRLLASPHYGERWGRYWLDLARYSDDQLFNQTKDDPFPNAYRYRDWVVQALNEDLPYDLFTKAQIAGDFLQAAEPRKYVAGLGFYGLSPQTPDDRIDATTRTFLGLTVACARCHDHKYDPIPTRDFYSLQGVFQSSEVHEYPLAPDPLVAEFQKQEKRIADLNADLKDFLMRETLQLGDILSSQTSRYLLAARQVLGKSKLTVAAAARQAGLDRETLQRWNNHLETWPKEHPYLDDWGKRVQAPEKDFRKWAEEFQTRLLSVVSERKELDRKNKNAEKGKPPDVLEASKANLWNTFYFSRPRPDLPYRPPLGIYYHGDVNQYPGMEIQVVRFLKGERREYVDGVLKEIETLKESLPAKYAFLHAIRDSAKPADLRVHIGGSKDKLGETAPRRFLEILSEGEPKPFQNGSGRLELAEAIASPRNPLTARVMVNRIWLYHFGRGIVGTVSNFGKQGERPTHPPLLDDLASRLISSHWSLKSLHREIMLSATYALSSAHSDRNAALDPGNRLYWRANRRRMDAEALRDSLLFVSGKLDPALGGPPLWLTENLAWRKGPDGEPDKYSQPAEWILTDSNRRTLYGYVSRRRPDKTMTLFDFPNPTAISEQRFATSTALQRLFFLNSLFVTRLSEALVSRLDSELAQESKIRRIYRILFSREPKPEELQLGGEFLKGRANGWSQYAQVLLSSNEFLFVK